MMDYFLRRKSEYLILTMEILKLFASLESRNGFLKLLIYSERLLYKTVKRELQN